MAGLSSGLHAVLYRSVRDQSAGFTSAATRTCRLEAVAPQRATRVRERAREAVARLAREFPGDLATGVLDEGEIAEQRFSEFANDEPCPALDPETGTCELYESRPMTCRTFGPPVRSEEGLGVCELCFHGASVEQIAACEMIPDPDDLESTLLQELKRTTGARGEKRLLLSRWRAESALSEVQPLFSSSTTQRA